MENCVICKEEIGVDPISGWDGGHNAEPIMTGRCCSVCNMSAVIPVRLKLLQISLDKNGGNKSWKKRIK